MQEANFDHRIQPETESLIKMIMDTPFVVRILCIFFKHLINISPVVCQHARRGPGGQLPVRREHDGGPHPVHTQPRRYDLPQVRHYLVLLSANVQCITYRVRSLASVYAGHHPRMSNPATPGCDGPVNEFAQHGRRLETVSSLSLIHMMKNVKVSYIHISRRHH